jgi:hypothetical protein
MLFVFILFLFLFKLNKSNTKKDFISKILCHPDETMGESRKSSGKFLTFTQSLSDQHKHLKNIHL